MFPGRRREYMAMGLSADGRQKCRAMGLSWSGRWECIVFDMDGHTGGEVIRMMNNQEIPIGFLMELAQHTEVLNRFSQLSEPEQHNVVEGARQVNSRDGMRDYVESIFRV